MQYLAKYQQAKLNCAKKRFTIPKFSANWSFFTKFLAILCKKYHQNHPFLQEMLLWNIKFNFGTCFSLFSYNLYGIVVILATFNIQMIKRSQTKYSLYHLYHILLRFFMADLYIYYFIFILHGFITHRLNGQLHVCRLVSSIGQSAAPVLQRSRVRIPSLIVFFNFVFRNCKSCLYHCDVFFTFHA